MQYYSTDHFLGFEDGGKAINLTVKLLIAVCLLTSLSMAALLQQVNEIFPILFELFERAPIALHYLLDRLDILLQLALVLILSSDVSF